MEGLNQTAKAPHTHKVSLLGRKTCALNGVVDVLAFDVNEIILETEQGMLMIKGSELHVTRLSLEKGEVDVEGRIDSLAYSDLPSSTGRKESIFGRLFS
ncbi:MAG: sporulation protein YabP [Lachnospiraceae bacterium]|nr:sporulation protein YabP [Lachnospiraceae bacterium]